MTNTRPTDTSEELRDILAQEFSANGESGYADAVFGGKSDPIIKAALAAMSRARSTHAGEGMVEANIKRMVQRFLGWKLPANFNPDNGISFDPIMNKGHAFESRREPVGTNLFSADQATEMVRYMVEGIADTATSRIILERIRGNAVAALECTKSARTYGDIRRYVQQVIDGIDVELALSPSKPAPVVSDHSLPEADNG